MENIKVNITNAISIEYTQEELEQEIRDLMFLRDSVLILLNPKECEKSDLPFDYDTTVKYLKEMYLESNYCKEFIKNVFNL